MTELHVRQLWIYPVKSLGGMQMDEVRITPAGSFEGDREWVIVNPRNEKLWQGDIPRMTLVATALTDTALTLRASGMAPLSIARHHPGPSAVITMYKQSFPGIDAGDAAAAWLAQALGQPVRLVRVGQGAHQRRDLNPVHVLSDASLAALNGALAARGDHAVEAERFRPNIVLGPADGEAFIEERLQTIRFGNAVLRFREPCIRCELPNISRIDASREKQPLKLIGTLSKTRPTAAPASFGIYAQVEGAGMLSIGMVADSDYLDSIGGTLNEWASPEDDLAYRDL